MKNLTEKMKNNSAAVLVPNPGKKSFRWKYFIFLLAAARAESLFFDSVPVDKIGEIIRAGMPEIYIWFSHQELRTRGWATWSTSGVIW